MSKGAMKAAMTIAAFTTLNNRNGVPWAAEVIERETGHRALLDALKELAGAIEAKADTGKRRQLTVSPKMEVALVRARAVISQAEEK